MDIQQRIDSAPRNILVARLKANEIDSRDRGDAKREKLQEDTINLVNQTPGENFKEIRQNILDNPDYESFGHKVKHLLAATVPNQIGMSHLTSHCDDGDMDRQTRPKLHNLTNAAIGVPGLESYLENIQAHPDSSEAQFQKEWLAKGMDQAISGVQGAPEYTAYKDVFPFIKDWNFAG